MLEEALKNDKKTPAELSIIMLSYVQMELPAGGTSAESRFFRLYEPLCDRIFGAIILGKDEKDRYRHKEGGWLSERSPWNRNPVISQHQQSQTRMSRSNTMPTVGRSNTVSGTQASSSIDNDPVVKFLGPSVKQNSSDAPLPTLIEAISSEGVNRPSWGFTFPFDALPGPLREAWLTTLETAHGGSPQVLCTENTEKLLSAVLRRGPREQKDLNDFRQLKAQGHQQLSLMKLSPRGFQSTLSPQQMYSPKSPVLKANEEKQRQGQTCPSVILNMLEHYLFTYFRFPMSKPISKYSPAPAGVYVHSPQREKEPYGDAVYYSLFRKYLRHFLPYEKDDNRHIALSWPENRESELFIRTLITMWLETQGKVKSTGQVVDAIIDRQRRAGMREIPKLDLDVAYDLIVVRYDPPVQQIQRCIRSVIVHFILDPVLNKDTVKETGWFLSNAMTILQQPFFNYVRTTFRHASIHQSESPFFGALEAWLIWLEPWNVNEPKRDFSPRHATQRIMGNVSGTKVAPKRTLTIAKQNYKSRYSPEWEPYIAANIHLYATPLAIFLRRSREFDFSANKRQRSMRTIQRVFRVFTPQVVDAVSRHLSGSSGLSHLVQRNVHTLGRFAPPAGPLSLPSCQTDMKALLEEIYGQHMKKTQNLDMIEKFEAYVEGLFNYGVVAGEEREITKVLEQARLIVQLPPDYTPHAGSQQLTISTSATETQETKELVRNGKLTEEGIRSVITGAAKMDPFSVCFVGDTNNARLGTHEIPILVELAKWLSKMVEQKTGVLWNFRFIADQRIVAVLLLSIVWKVLL